MKTEFANAPLTLKLSVKIFYNSVHKIGSIPKDRCVNPLNYTHSEVVSG